jgi:hypothetical protein
VINQRLGLRSGPSGRQDQVALELNHTLQSLIQTIRRPLLSERQWSSHTIERNDWLLAL